MLGICELCRKIVGCGCHFAGTAPTRHSSYCACTETPFTQHSTSPLPSTGHGRCKGEKRAYAALNGFQGASISRGRDVSHLCRSEIPDGGCARANERCSNRRARRSHVRFHLSKVRQVRQVKQTEWGQHRSLAASPGVSVPLRYELGHPLHQEMVGGSHGG